MEQKKSIKEAIEEMILEAESGTLDHLLPASKRIKAIMPDIELLKKQGYSDAIITEGLNKMGIQITVSSFKNALHRLRKAA